MGTGVVASSYGGPEVLDVVPTEPGPPGSGEVRIAVRAAGVNPIDVKLAAGAMGSDPARLPLPLGLEVSGEVTAVGDDAAGPAGPVAVGDEVIAYPVRGGYASDVLVPSSSVLPKPETMTWPEAAGLMLTGVTAVHALQATAVGVGDTVLVHGVSGGVGLTVAQLALGDGATVVGTASERHHERLRGLGVVPVAYGDGLAERVRGAAPSGVDAAIDTVGTDEAVEVSLALVADPDRVVSIAAFGRAGEVRLIGGGPGADPGTEIRSAARLELVRRVAAGSLTVEVARTFPLAETADAHRLVASGHAGGKVVLVP